MKAVRIFCPWGFFCAIFFLIVFAAIGHASITNESDESIRVKIKKTSGRVVSTTMYPNQTMRLPEDAATVRILPIGPVRDDVGVSVTIIEADGTETTIEDYGNILTLGEKYEANVEINAGAVENLSNVAVLIRIKRSSGSAKKKRLSPGQAMDLPANALSVTVLPDGGLWGDEKIEVEVTLTDGTTETISRYDGVVKTVKEKTALTLTQFPS